MPRGGRSVRRLQRRGDVAGLIEALGRHDWTSDGDGRLIDVAVRDRVDAANALRELGAAQDAVLPLTTALQDRQPAVRGAALEALAAAELRGATHAIARAVAGWRSSELEDLRERGVLLLMQREDPDLAVVFAEAIVEDPSYEPLDRDAGVILRRLTSSSGGSDVATALAERLVDRLRTGTPQSGARVGALLAGLGEDAVEPLMAALDDPATQRAVIPALGAVGDRRAVPELASLLFDEDPVIRVRAAEALGAIRDPQATEALLRATGDEDAAVRDAAQVALDALGNIGVILGVAALVQPILGRVEQLEQAFAERDERPLSALEPAKPEAVPQQPQQPQPQPQPEAFSRRRRRRRGRRSE
jgi:hypothetical protein